MVDFRIHWKRKLHAMTDQNYTHKPEQLIDVQPSTIAPTSPQKTEVVPASHPTGEIQNKAEDDKPKWTDKTVAFFTLFLFLAAVIQGIIFYKQWQEMHFGGADTHDLALSAKAQAEASKTQAEEATAQVKQLAESLKKTDALIAEATAQATATSQEATATHVLAVQAQRSADYAQQAIKTSVEAERPWLGISGLDASNFSEGQTAIIAITITNSGKRPASATVASLDQIAKSLPLYPNASGQQPSVAFVLPGGSFRSVLSYDVPSNAFSDWKKDKVTFFVVAEIVYTDVVTNIAYITHYCTYFVPGDKNQPFNLCTRYNEAK